MALGAPSPPSTPTGTVPPPPNVLVFRFDTPGPGTYQINVAMGDALVAVSNQQLQVYDGTTLLATLFTGASAPADSYIDAQGNVLSASNWSILNASRTFFFQTNMVSFVIGDGVNHAYIASLQVRAATGTQTQIIIAHKRVRQFRRVFFAKWFKRRLYAIGAPPLPLAKPRPLARVKTRPQLRVKRPRKTYPFPVRVVPIVVRPTKHPPWPRRKPLRTKRRQLLPRFLPPVPVAHVISYRRLHPLKIKRTFHTLRRQRYPTLPTIVVSSGSANPTARIVVLVT